MNDLEKIPQFNQPTAVQSQAVNSLLNDGFIVSSGIVYHKYKLLTPLDQVQISKNRSAIFLFKDNNAYFNSRRVFCEITYSATDHENNGLKPSQFVGGTAPCAHSLIDTVSINVRQYKSIRRTDKRRTDRPTE